MSELKTLMFFLAGYHKQQEKQFSEPIVPTGWYRMDCNLLIHILSRNYPPVCVGFLILVPA